MKFTAKKINPLGENDIKYGQKYWGYVEESEMAVSFNLMSPVDIHEGAALEFEERLIKETKKGTEYLFLRKVKVSGSPLKTSQNAPESATSTKLLELIYEDTQKILKLVDKNAAPQSLRESWDKTSQAKSTINEPVDNVVEDIGDGPISLEDIPF